MSHFGFVHAVSLQGHGGALLPPCASLEIVHHGDDLPSIDGGMIPGDAVTSLSKVATDLSVHHTADELFPRVLIIATVGHTRSCGVVEELIILDPEGSIPGFVVCPTVVGSGAHRCCVN